MDLTRFLTDTTAIESALERARARNRRVQLLAERLSGHDEEVVAAALDALVAALDTAPALAVAARPARRSQPAEPATTTTTDAAPASDAQPRPKRHRATKAEFEAAKSRLLNALDREGKTARQLQAELGDDYERNALLALLREGRAVAVARGQYALA